MYIGESNSFPVDVVTGASVLLGTSSNPMPRHIVVFSVTPGSYGVGMRLFNRTKDNTNFPLDPFTDPVGYLAGLGIEAELVEVITCLPEAA